MENNRLAYPKTANFDDQIISKEAVLFDVFVCRERFWHGELSEEQSRVVLGEDVFELKEGVVYHQGKLWNTQLEQPMQEGNQQKQEVFPSVSVIAHEELTVHTTLLPKKIIVFGSVNGSAITLTTRSFAVLDVALDARYQPETYTLILKANGDPAYFRGKKVDTVDEEFQVGDRFIIGGVSIERRPKQFKVTDLWGRKISMDAWKLLALPYEPEVPADFPEYRRSPRILRVPPDEKLSIQAPEALHGETKSELMRTVLPPLTMIGASVLTTVVSNGNPLMILGMGSVSVLTTALSVSSYFTNRKEGKQKKIDRETSYIRYMVKQQARLNQLEREQREALTHHYPDMDTLSAMAVEYHSRIYEKTPSHEDFLDFALGLGAAVTSYEIDFSAGQQSEDPLLLWAQDKVLEPRRVLKQMPIPVKMLDQTLGFAGSYPVLRTAVATMLFQTALFHSYQDVQFLALVPEEHHEKDWAYWRWLPHFQMQAFNLRGLVHNAQTRDIVLNSFYQMLNKRRQAVRESGQERPNFSPHYIMVIIEDSYLFGHGLNEFLAEDMSRYGVTVIWCKDAMRMLPETVTTMVQYLSPEAAKLVNEEKIYVAKTFKPYHLPEKYPLDLVIQRLSNLHHVEVEKNAIPEAITFLDMYQVKHVEELGAAARWEKADASKTLAVPLGLRGKDDLVELNLHERAHGPHGLVAGTTGSGKSEIIQSYILSLAINFAPEDVGFLPIDFKGGGMANELKGLPHMLGSITNLDGASSARALASIRAELQKRQRMFAKYGVNHINGYTKRYKAGKEMPVSEDRSSHPQTPIPHLFLISDEFAELKANQPDFMEELVSVARIGRSLGVHLILATQKPSGVVSEQIWSNSRFKLALKVADEADSNEVIKTPDAASIVEPGRAYLQVGNNEVYELFQSAWSGAVYDPDVTYQETVDDRIWLINDLGQYQLLSTDLSTGEEQHGGSEEERITQLRAVVNYVAKIAGESGALLPEAPWLPPLAHRIPTPETDWEAAWKKERDIKIPLAQMDIPSRQAQEDFLFDFEAYSHTAIYASAGFGKSTLLQTMVMNLARQNTPEQVQFNLLDFGTNGLLPLQELPHVTDLVRLDEHEKLQKMLGLISTQLEERKQQFQQAGVASLTQYEQRTNTKLPAIITLLDGYDALESNDAREVIDPVLTQILREGSSLGVYLVITANRSNSLRMAMTSNIPTKIVMYMVDEDELSTIIGREKLVQQDIAGRIQMQLDEVVAMQIYLPNGEKTSLGILSKLAKEIEAMKGSWEGTTPESLPIVAAEFDLEAFHANPDVQKWQKTGNLPIGLALKDTRPLGYLVEKHPYFVLSYTMEEQLYNQQQLLVSQLTFLREQYKLYMVDFEQEHNGMHETFDHVYKEDLMDAEPLEEMLMEYIAAAKSNEAKEPVILYISDLEDFSRKLVMFSEDNLVYLLTKAHKAGIHIILHTTEKHLKTFSSSGQVVRDNAKAGIIGTRVSDSAILQEIGRSTDPQLLNNEAYYFEAQGRRFEKIRIPGKM